MRCVRSYFYLLVFLLPRAAFAQADWSANDFPYWQDSMNVRVHVTHLLNWVLHQRPMQWDTATGSYKSSIPSMLRFDAISGSRYRRVQWRKIATCKYDQTTMYGRQVLPEKLMHILDSTFEKGDEIDAGQVEYDRDGYLKRSITGQHRQHKFRDTIEYEYEWHGGRISNIYISAHRHVATYKQQSSGKRHEINRSNTATYSFNILGLLWQIDFNYDREHTMNEMRYDATGRLTRLADSSVTDGRLKREFTYAYRDVPLHIIYDDTEAYKREYPALMLPQISNWLQQKKGATIWCRDERMALYLQDDRATRKYTYTLPPTMSYAHKEWIMDDRRNTWARMEDDKKWGHITLYQYGTDQEGSFMGEYQLQYLPEADTVKYDHNEQRASGTRRQGCIVENDYKYPRKGSIPSSVFNYTERNIYTSSRGFRLITYDRPRPSWGNWTQDDHEWAPEAWRPPSWQHSFADFVLCGADGLPKYVGANHYLYRLTYE